ncbi:hypothetical protein Trydic_g7291 [Trypoxylus dichotomus]
MVYSRPSINPFICDDEKQKLEIEFGSIVPKAIPWAKFLSDASVWVLIVAQISQNFYIIAVEAQLPRYLDKVQSVDISNNLYLFIVPALCQVTSLICSGYLADYIIQSKLAPVEYTRVIFTAVGILLPTAFVILSTFANSNKRIILPCFIMATFTKGPVYAGLNTNTFDITRNFSATIFTFVNAIAATIGLVAPFVIGFICQQDTIAEWRSLFCLSLIVSLFTITLYFVWARGNRADWDKIKSW